jgi:DNA-binding transcriptional regulator YiaG
MKQLKNGWIEGSVQDFLDLSDAEMEFIELRRTLAHQVRALRQERGLSQTALAVRLKTSQSRLAKMEAADPTVSMDLLLQTIFRLGMKRRDLAKAI